MAWLNRCPRRKTDSTASVSMTNPKLTNPESNPSVQGERKEMRKGRLGDILQFNQFCTQFCENR